MTTQNFQQETLALHGTIPRPAGPIQTPIVASTAFKFTSAKQASDLFALRELGDIYSRLTNPTVSELASRLAQIHGAVGAFCTSSGHSAQLLAFFNILQPGDHIVASSYLYGGSITQLTHTFPKQFGWQATLVDINNLENIKNAITDKTKAVYIETQSNPNGVIADIQGIAEVAHAHGIPLIVDNTVPTPFLLNPIEFGADIVTYSLSKYISGNNSVIGGAVVDSGNFDWTKQADKFPLLNEPDDAYNGISFARDTGNLAFTFRGIAVGLRDLGTTLSPYAAADILKGLETLHIRMERHAQNAQKVAEFLEGHAKVSKVHFPNLKSSPYHALTQKYLPKGASSLFGIEINGDIDQASKVVDSFKLFIHCAQIGDSRSLAIHPATTTHSQLDKEKREKSGAKDNYIRLSIGIENVDDIIADLEQALSVL